MTPRQPSVLVERRGAVQVITLNRPQQRNALNGEVAQHIAAAVDELDGSDDLRVAVLTGAGGVFSAGMDLKAFLTGETPVVTGRGLCGITITPPRKPLVAAVEGWALAGGLELLLACDLVVASETARLGTPEVTRGIVAGGGGAYFLPTRVPRAIALEMLLTGEPISAARATEIGLVNRLVPAGTALREAVTLAEQIAANSPSAVATTKEIVSSAGDWTRDEWWARQPAMMRQVLESADAREGATAFAERRTPVWGTPGGGSAPPSPEAT
jgi:enoyl-CoA hydratase